MYITMFDELVEKVFPPEYHWTPALKALYQKCLKQDAKTRDAALSAGNRKAWNYEVFDTIWMRSMKRISAKAKGN